MKYSKEAYVALEMIEKIAGENQILLKKLSLGDDWSFIIKCVAFTESILNRALVSQTKSEVFEKIFSRLSISTKINMAYELGLFTSKYEKLFLEYLVSLRNKLAHDPKEMDFSFQEYFSKMTKQELDNFKTHMKIDNDEKDDEYYGFIFKHPKDGIWVLLNSVLAVLVFRQEFNKVEKWTNFESEDYGKTLLTNFVDDQMSEEHNE